MSTGDPGCVVRHIDLGRPVVSDSQDCVPPTTIAALLLGLSNAEAQDQMPDCKRNRVSSLLIMEAAPEVPREQDGPNSPHDTAHGSLWTQAARTARIGEGRLPLGRIGCPIPLSSIGSRRRRPPLHITIGAAGPLLSRPTTLALSLLSLATMLAVAACSDRRGSVEQVVRFQDAVVLDVRRGPSVDTGRAPKVELIATLKDSTVGYGDWQAVGYSACFSGESISTTGTPAEYESIAWNRSLSRVFREPGDQIVLEETIPNDLAGPSLRVQWGIHFVNTATGESLRLEAKWVDIQH